MCRMYRVYPHSSASFLFSWSQSALAADPRWLGMTLFDKNAWKWCLYSPVFPRLPQLIRFRYNFNTFRILIVSNFAKTQEGFSQVVSQALFFGSKVFNSRAATPGPHLIFRIFSHLVQLNYIRNTSWCQGDILKTQNVLSFSRAEWWRPDGPL